jgi:hypothetical protein
LRGLEWCFSRERVQDSVEGWFHDADPIYLPLLHELTFSQKSRFIADWQLGQTLATNCRFFMEEAIRGLIAHQVQHFGRSVRAVYIQRDLEKGVHAQLPDLAFFGDERKEWASGRGWHTALRASALDTVDRIADAEDRALDQILGEKRVASADVQARFREGLLPPSDVRARLLDSLAGEGPPEKTLLSCNLVVVEPEPGPIHAFRFINLKNAGRATVQSERKNFLRLIAHVHQEKLFRRPEACHVILAPLVDRDTRRALRHYSLRFDQEELWQARKFWEFINVPYSAVQEGLLDAGRRLPHLLDEAIKGLRSASQLKLFDY